MLSQELIEAIRQDRVHVVQAILRRDYLEVGSGLEVGSTLLWQAVFNNAINVARLLVQTISELNIDDEIDDFDPFTTPLHWTCKNGNDAMAKILIDNGASLIMKTSLDETALLLAIKYDNLNIVCEILEKLKEYKDDGTYDIDTILSIIEPEDEMELGEGPFFESVKSGNLMSTGALLQYRPPTDINYRDIDGCTLLWYAAERGHTQIVNLLMLHGATVNEVDDLKKTPLYAAVENCRLETVKMLVHWGADVNMGTTAPLYDTVEASPLNLACRMRHIDICKVLIDANADSSILESEAFGVHFGSDLNLLSTIACIGDLEFVNFLLKVDAVENIVNLSLDGIYSPLYMAAAGGHLSVVEALLKAGADKSTRSQGKTALEIAREQNHGEVVQVISQWVQAA